MKSTSLFLSVLCLSTAASAYAPLSEESQLLDQLLSKAIVLPNTSSERVHITKYEHGLVLLCFPGHRASFSYLRVDHTLFERYGSDLLIFCENGRFSIGRL